MADPGAFDNVLKTLERNIKLLDFQLKSINTNRENIAAAEERMRDGIGGPDINDLKKALASATEMYEVSKQQAQRNYNILAINYPNMKSKLPQSVIERFEAAHEAARKHGMSVSVV